MYVYVFIIPVIMSSLNLLMYLLYTRMTIEWKSTHQYVGTTTHNKRGWYIINEREWKEYKVELENYDV